MLPACFFCCRHCCSCRRTTVICRVRARTESRHEVQLVYRTLRQRERREVARVAVQRVRTK